VWRKNEGTQEEYNTWRTNFGRTAGGGDGSVASFAAKSAVPEPSTVLLIMAGCFVAGGTSRNLRARWRRLPVDFQRN
jgi:hypothetical protein